MIDAVKIRWVRVSYWALSAAMLLGWILETGSPEWPMLLSYCALLAYMIHSRTQLPERVASHFRFDLQPDGWLARRVYLTVMLGLTTVVLIALACLSFSLRQVNQPFMARHLLRFDCIFVGLIAGIHALIVSANRNGESRRLSPLFWILLAGFLGMLALWAVAITTHARWGWPR